MNDDPRLERDVVSVLAGMAPSHGPRDLLDDVFLTTGRMRPRPRWLALVKEPPMRYSSRVTVGSPTFRLVTIAALTVVLLLASVIAVGVGARVLAADPVPAPFGPAKSGQLLISAGGDIYLADPDGEDRHAIVSGGALDQIPWFSPGGTRIAFGRGSEIARSLMVADADGSNVTELLPAGSWWAEFLPGDDQMIVTRMVGGTAQASIIDVGSGATVRDLDLGDMGWDWWFITRPPDGDELIFRGYPDADAPHVGLYAIGIDGTGLRAIGPISTTESDDRRASFLDPSITPDGHTIVYWNWEPGSPASTTSGPYLHLRDTQTGEELPVPFDRSGSRPVYSPDGTMILYERSTSDSTRNQLAIVPADGSQPAVLIGPTYRHEDWHSFGFSPDGRTVLLVQAGTSTFIDIATGETSDLGSDGGPEASGWQRLAG